MLRNRNARFFLASAAALALGTVANAAPYDWNNASGGNFQTGGNWTPAGPPGAADDAHFGLSGSYTVDFDASTPVSTDGLTIDGSNLVTFDLRNSAYTAASSASPGFSVSGTAKLILSNSQAGGSLVSNSDTFLGGAGLELNTSGGFGATFTVNNDVVATAPIVVSGAGSHLQHTSAFFNLQGSTLTIQNGGKVTAANFQYTAGGESVVVDGVGSEMITNSNGARVVAWGPSTASVINGGKWDTSGYQFEMGILYGAGQVVTVGNGVNTSTIIASDFFFGGISGDPRGTSEMFLNTGGLIRATSASGSVRITDGDTLTINGGVAEIASAGQVNVEDSVAAGGATGQLRGSGTIRRVTGGASNFTVTNDGQIRPGDISGTPVTGTIAIENGHLVQNSGGTIFLNLASGNAADLIDITGGNATINGTIDFSVIGGYTPMNGDIWNVIRADSITFLGGTFAAAQADVIAALSAAGYNGNVAFGVVSEGGQQVLQVALPEPASAAMLGLGTILIAARRRKA